MTNRASSHRRAITHQVRHDQRSRKEDLAEDEVAEKAVPFAAGDTAGQKAMAVQMTADRIDQSHQPVPTSRPPCLGCPSRSLVSDYSVLPPCGRQDRRRSAAELAASAQQTPPRRRWSSDIAAKPSPHAGDGRARLNR